MVALSGCGGGDGDQTDGSLPKSGKLRADLTRATTSIAADFPATRGKTLQQLADSLDGAGTQVGLATSVFTPGRARLAFGVISDKTGFVYGKTAIYIAKGPDAKARGPYPAPADLLITDPAYRSKNAATEADAFAAIYETFIPLNRTGHHAILVITKLKDGQTIGAATSINVVSAAADKVPAVGEAAPRVQTDTLTSAKGNIAAIDTRSPPDDMHDANLADVLGKKPVAILFATPQLCQSRVCGPVVDVTAQLKAAYGDRMTFIHEEVYRDNDPSKGLREPLERFNLKTEPWLFVMDATGKVTARLEGSFGFTAVKRAIETGL